MHYLPINIDLQNRPVLVVGAGPVAARKIALLMRRRAQITVIAPHAVPAIRKAQAEHRLTWHARRFLSRDLNGQQLIFAATGDRLLHARLQRAARRRGVWINVVDDRKACDFIMPAIVDRGEVQVAISSSGSAPVLARRLREHIEARLPQTIGPLAAFLSRHRRTITDAVPDCALRRQVFEAIIDGPVADAIAAGREAQADDCLYDLLHHNHPQRGRVSLVGAGPGDPELLTIKALRRLQRADVIIHDGLVDARILDLARRDAERIDAAKRCGHKRVTQHDIHRWMRDHALAGAQVVRLKGGDPLIFGRGGEELEYLRRWRVPFEVVPGITAAAGCAAYAGIPLTHREHASTLTITTAQGQDHSAAPDWAQLARGRQTLCIYMGVRALPTVQARLIEHGRSPKTPVTLVENGTRPEQRVVVGQLGGLAALAQQYALQSPTLIFIGETAALATQLAWFGARPVTTNRIHRAALVQTDPAVANQA